MNPDPVLPEPTMNPVEFLETLKFGAIQEAKHQKNIGNLNLYNHFLQWASNYNACLTLLKRNV